MDVAAVPGEHAVTLSRRPEQQPEPASPQVRGRAQLLALAALLAPVLLVALLAWLGFGSYDQLMMALDRGSARGPCHGPDGVKPLCDFANHYYPQGLALAQAPGVVHGFYYSGFFAIWMRWLALLDFPVARALWAALIAAAALTLILTPLLRELRRSLAGCALHGLLYACALPLWHDLAFGQVSGLLTALVVLSFVAYARRQRTLAAVLLALATSIKFYPAIFAVYFALRRDRRALVVFAAAVLVCTGVLPLLVLGESGFATYYRSLFDGLANLSRGMAPTPYPNFIANAVTWRLAGHVNPASVLFQAMVVMGLGIAGLHAYLAWRVLRARAEQSVLPSLMLGLATLPFVVRSCWVHYFIFLPLLQGYVGQLGFRADVPRFRRALAIGLATLSALIVSMPFLLLLQSGDFYKAGLPFWATAILLPGLYLRVLGDIRGEPAVVCQ
jgi:hypothetical protein